MVAKRNGCLRTRRGPGRLVALGLLTLTASLAFADEDLGAWQKRMPITFSGYEGAETLTNFPALVVLSNTPAGVGFDYADFQSPPYGDLRFAAADKTTPLDFEVDTWNTDGVSYVWVKVPELTADTTLYALWGKAGVEAPPCTTNGAVWEDAYRAVWHMNDGAANAHIADSTTNGVVGTKKAAGPPVETNAVVGQGQQFNSNYINVTGLSNTGTTHTFSMWINGSSTAANQFFFDAFSGRFLLGWGTDKTGQIGLYDGTWRYFGTTPSLNVWHHLVVVCKSSGSAMLYLDGLKYGSTVTYAPKSIGGDVSLGSRYSFNQNYFPGYLDEVRVSADVRSSNWVSAAYLNMASNALFSTYDAPQFFSGPTIANSNAVVGASEVTLNGWLTHTGRDANVSAYVFWGTNDAGTVRDAWANTNLFPVPASIGLLSTNVVPTAAGTLHFYRFYATNQYGECWAEPTGSFRWLGPPIVDLAGGATNVTSLAATLRGEITSG